MFDKTVTFNYYASFDLLDVIDSNFRIIISHRTVKCTTFMNKTLLS